MNVRISFDFVLNKDVSPEWFAERLFDVLCHDVEEAIPGAVDSVDGYDFKIER